MSHNECTCDGCMMHRALTAEREVERLTAELEQMTRIAAAFLEGVDEEWAKSDFHRAALADWRKLKGGS